jgi:hypothetical protein
MLNLGSKGDSGSMLIGSDDETKVRFPSLHISNDKVTDLIKMLGDVGDTHTIKANIKVSGRTESSDYQSIELEFIDIGVVDSKNDGENAERMYPSMKE